jgi:hypothetical protein
MPRSNYSEAMQQKFIDRANKFMKDNPNTSRTKVAQYAGVSVSVLESYEKQGRIKLPAVLSQKQIRKLSPWATNLGGLSGRRS